MLYPDYQFTPSYCADMVRQCEELIRTRTSFNLVALPGVGITFFVKYLESRSPASFLDINPYEMHELTQEAVYAQLARRLGVSPRADLHELREALGRRLETENDGVVILFNRFDRLRKVLDEQFYDNIRFLRDVNRAKVMVGFVTTEPLIGEAGSTPRELVSLITRTVYFAGYQDDDIQQLLAAGGSRRATPDELRLAGGHHLLLQVVMGCQDTQNALSDPIVELLIKDIASSLSSRRYRALERAVVSGKPPRDQYLEQAILHVLSAPKGGYRTFSPLLDEYLMRRAAVHLPQKEARLFELLRHHQGSVVTKSAIFDYVWREDDGIASDWSLNALVYRLRRHPGFDATRYEIVSHKKSGYVLIDNFDG